VLVAEVTAVAPFAEVVRVAVTGVAVAVVDVGVDAVVERASTARTVPA